MKALQKTAAGMKLLAWLQGAVVLQKRLLEFVTWFVRRRIANDTVNYRFQLGEVHELPD